jgi:hypothetical protein
MKRVYVSNIEQAPLVLPEMEFDLPRPKKTRKPKYVGKDEVPAAPDEEAPLPLPRMDFERGRGQ